MAVHDGRLPIRPAYALQIPPVATTRVATAQGAELRLVQTMAKLTGWER
jgi:hypothetical protein